MSEVVNLRRAPKYKRAIDALACVCKQDELAVPRGDEPLLGGKGSDKFRFTPSYRQVLPQHP